MRPVFPLLAGLLLAGCGAPATVGTESTDSGSTPAPAEIIKPASMDDTQIGLFHDDDVVHVGDPKGDAKKDALSLYPIPRSNAYDLTEVPAPLANQPSNPYGVAGWESYNGDGYGLILYNEKVAAAMYQLERTQQIAVDQYVELEKSKMPGIEPDEIGGDKLHYWFWQDKNKTQTLMICRLDAARGFYNLTVAMGDDNVLRALGVSEASARANAPRIDKTSRPVLVSPGPSSPNSPN